MKIGIITLNGYYNYGNRLQNYALQAYLCSLGHEVDTILVDNRTADKQSKIKKVFGEIEKQGTINSLKKIRMKIVKIVLNVMNKRTNLTREKIFRDFTTKYINETNFRLSEIDIPVGFVDKYDVFFVGSDQVWNPSNTNNSSIYFLGFAPQNKRFSYAASFGVSKLYDYQKPFYRSQLASFGKISVRENEGAEIIKELLNSKPPVLVDPTMLIKNDDWQKLLKAPPTIVHKKYLLTYFLGKTPKKFKDQINMIAERFDLDILDLGNPKSKAYISGPNEFLYYVKHCSLMCTDSFHGLVFSIIFEKPFVAYSREGANVSMISRVHTLLDKFNLQNRFYDGFNIDDTFNTDYSNINQILEFERSIAYQFIDEALRSCEVNE